MGPATVAGWHHLIEAQRLAYADRDKYVADDRLVAVPLAGLTDKDYLRSRAALVSPSRAMAVVEAGKPPGAPSRGRDATAEVPGTSHFVVVDRMGNVVSMTTTVESLFGSQRFVAGFFLNNQLTDFSFRPVDDRGEAIANAVAPGKKPRSSMSPTLVFRDGVFTEANINRKVLKALRRSADVHLASAEDQGGFITEAESNAQVVASSVSYAILVSNKNGNLDFEEI